MRNTDVVVMKTVRILFVLCLLFSCAALLAAQNSGLAMPSISAPQMPSISDFPQVSSSASPQTAATAQTTAATADTDRKKVTAANLATLSASLLSGTNTTNSSSDLISSLLGNTTQQKLSGTNTATNVILEQILEKLDKLDNLAPVVTDSRTETAAEKTQPVKQTGAKILRCSANGYNILETCRTVFSSSKSADGSFLITGDRKYLSNYKTRDETFYLFFRRFSPDTYELAASVLQDYENTYSFMYQLSKKTPLKVSVVGNLISLKISEPDWKFDLLIDIADLK